MEVERARTLCACVAVRFARFARKTSEHSLCTTKDARVTEHRILAPAVDLRVRGLGEGLC